MFYVELLTPTKKKLGNCYIGRICDDLEFCSGCIIDYLIYLCSRISNYFDFPLVVPRIKITYCKINYLWIIFQNNDYFFLHNFWSVSCLDTENVVILLNRIKNYYIWCLKLLSFVKILHMQFRILFLLEVLT